MRPSPRPTPRHLRRTAPVALVLLAAGLGGTYPAGAQPAPPGWGALEPRGPVGFRVLRVEDPTRVYGPMPPPAAETWAPRPLQLGVWYPAASPGGAPAPMVLGDVVELLATELGEAVGDPAGARAEARRDLLKGRIDPYLAEGADPAAELERVLATPLLARAGAPPAPGLHPVVLHTGVLHTQVLLNEYLASRGYVVVGVPLMGSSPAWRGRGESGPAMWEGIARDLAVAAAAAAELPFADGERSASIGMLAGGGLLHAMRDPRVDAVALLDAWLPPGLRELPGWDPLELRAPLLVLRNTERGRTDGAVLDSMVFALRVDVQVDALTHADFYPFPRYVHPHRAEEEWPGYAIVARHTAAFLDEVLLGGDPLDRPSSDAERTTVMRRPALPAPPRERTILSHARHGRAAEALAAVTEALERDPGARPVDPAALLTVARFLWRDGARDEAAAAARAVLLLDPGNRRAGRIVEAAAGGGG